MRFWTPTFTLVRLFVLTITQMLLLVMPYLSASFGGWCNRHYSPSGLDGRCRQDVSLSNRSCHILAWWGYGGDILGAQGFFGRGIERFCLIRCEPFCQGFNLGRNSEERIHVLAAIIVLACNLADGYLVILGRSIEPRTLHFVDCHNIVSRDVFKWFNALN